MVYGLWFYNLTHDVGALLKPQLPTLTWNRCWNQWLKLVRSLPICDLTSSTVSARPLDHTGDCVAFVLLLLPVIKRVFVWWLCLCHILGFSLIIFYASILLHSPEQGVCVCVVAVLGEWSGVHLINDVFWEFKHACGYVKSYILPSAIWHSSAR